MRHYGVEGDNAQNLSFMDAVWEIARRGIVRPSPKLGTSSQSHYSSNRFSITEQGINWLKNGKKPFVFTTASAYQDTLCRFQDRLGTNFLTWAREAAVCYQFNLYIATCAMSGTSGESILRHLHKVKFGEEQTVKIFKEKNSRNKTIDALAQARNDIKNRLQSFNNKLSAWRNDSVHGDVPYMEDFHAYESLSALFSLAKYAHDNFERISEK